ncbi:MAG: AAA family ATPase, partial [Candidatus Methanomethylophilaceae archaeon]|nr:AAA family ATPase [Candidatus Methanomethylophilaceae archaeon]
MARIDFIGRTRELEILEDEYSNARSFILMTGRRRVGKTRLIKEFIKDKDALYFYCNKVNTRSILDELSASIAQYSDRTFGEFRDWKEAFSAFAHCKDGKKLLVIDEFQNMIYADKDIIAYMQDILDNTLSGEEV